MAARELRSVNDAGAPRVAPPPPKRRAEEALHPAPDSQGGFRAHLPDKALADLVQLECLARVRRVVRVSSSGRDAYLFFAEGRVIHAELGHISGEAAAFEILAWETGDFRPCERPWPRTPTISMSAEALLMRAAHAKDEAARGNSGLLTAPPMTPSAHSPDEDEESVETAPRLIAPTSSRAREATEKRPMSEPNDASARNSEGALPYVRVDAQGNVIEVRGDVEELAAVAAYAGRLALLIGQGLGLDAFTSMERVIGQTHCFIVARPGGELVAVLAPASTDVAALRKRCGL